MDVCGLFYSGVRRGGRVGDGARGQPVRLRAGDGARARRHDPRRGDGRGAASKSFDSGVCSILTPSPRVVFRGVFSFPRVSRELRQRISRVLWKVTLANIRLGALERSVPNTRHTPVSICPKSTEFLPCVGVVERRAAWLAAGGDEADARAAYVDVGDFAWRRLFKEARVWPSLKRERERERGFCCV